MALSVPNSPTTQKGIGFEMLVDDAWKSYMNLGPKNSKKFVRALERAYRKAMVVIVKQVKKNIQSSNALATGFMRSSVTAEVQISDFFPKIEALAFIGTKAWYDVLVHEGLGRHGSGYIPAKYLPTPEQLAIVPKSHRSQWKRSPKVPRPFLRDAINQTKKQVFNIIVDGMKEAHKSLGAKPSAPKHKIISTLNAGGLR